MTLANSNAPKPANLFDLTSDWHELQIKLSDFDGEISDEDKEAEIDKLFADIAENQDHLESKVDGYIAMMATFEARAELRKRESTRLKALADRDQKQFDWLEGRLSTFLKVIDRKDFQTAYHHLKFKKAGGKRAITWNNDIFALDDISALVGGEIPKDLAVDIPARVIPASMALNKDAVREYLEARELAPPHERRTDLPFATLEPRKETLVIK